MAKKPVGPPEPPSPGPFSAAAGSRGIPRAVLSPCCFAHSQIVSAEPPVRILQPRRPLPVVTASLGETVVLGCELSRADAPVHWAKEGVRLEAGGSLVLEEEGAHRRLLIPAAQAEHSGKYVCDATDDTVTFAVQVLGEQEAGVEPGEGCTEPQRYQLC